MAETDALKGFDFNEVSPGSGTFLKFEAGKPIKIRVLTVDPVMSINSQYGNTTFGFVVYNLTDGKAQILSASPGVAKRIGAIHADEDFGANIRKLDLKITPTGEKLERKYDIQILPNATDLTPEQIKEAAAIDLEGTIAKNAGWSRRLSFYDKEEYASKQKEFKPEGDTDEPDRADRADPQPDPIEDLGGEPIDINDIPF